jgi:hypothetical protein
MICELSWRCSPTSEWVKETYKNMKEALDQIRWLRKNEFEVNEYQHRVLRRVPNTLSSTDTNEQLKSLFNHDDNEIEY